MISLGTGVGACVMDEGTPLRVSGTTPGHLGQVDVTLDDADTPVGPDGGRGGLEAYVGLPAMLARFRCTPDTLQPHLTIDSAPVLALVRAIRIAHAIYRPMHVRLAGGVGVRLGAIAGEIRSRVAAALTGVAREGWTLEAARSEFHAASGAARLALEKP